MKTVYDFIRSEESAYANPISVIDGYDWSMKDHIKTTVLYKNSQLLTGKSDDKPVKNIILPILRLAYRSEGFDVKDIQLYINDADEYYKSFLVKKFHENWALENDIDTFIDELVESYVDFGGVLVKDVNDVRPEVVPLQSLAFCDQSDLLSGPFAIKHFYSPDQLKEMESVGWGSEKNGATATIDEIIVLSRENKTPDKQTNESVKTPGKYIEIYEVHGTLPDHWLTERDPGEEDKEKYTSQLQIVTFLTKEDGRKEGITLFKGKEKTLPFKLLLRDKIHGRALGLGGAEELFEAQVWTTYDQIRIKGLLDGASKVIFQTSDPSYSNRNRLQDMENMEITVTADGARVEQVNTTPVNMALFERQSSEWDVHAKELGSATGATAGQSPGMHTSYNAIALLTQQGLAIHDYRKGKIATFVGEIYRDWVIPYVVREITKGQKFLSELSLEELQQVATSLVVNQANDYIKLKILSGETIQDGEIDQYKQKVQEMFMKGGTSKFIEILKGEIKDANVDVKVSIKDKQKDLTLAQSTMTTILQYAIKNPTSLDDPRIAKIYNMYLELHNLDPISFYTPPKPPTPPTNKVIESMAYKDTPDDIKRQIEQQAGMKPSQITPPQPVPVQGGLPVTK